MISDALVVVPVATLPTETAVCAQLEPAHQLYWLRRQDGKHWHIFSISKEVREMCDTIDIGHSSRKNPCCSISVHFAGQDGGPFPRASTSTISSIGTNSPHVCLRLLSFKLPANIMIPGEGHKIIAIHFKRQRPREISKYQQQKQNFLNPQSVLVSTISIYRLYQYITPRVTWVFTRSP